jgi:DNA-binding MarR family transcriptional regulator
MYEDAPSHALNEDSGARVATVSTEHPGLPEALNAVRELIVAIQRWLETVGTHLGVGAGEILILSCLSEHETRTPGQLAASLGRNASTVTAALDRLERAGLIRRQPHANDRRKIEVTVTESGQHAQSWLFQASAGAAEGLDPSQLGLLSVGFRQLARAIDEQTSVVDGSDR